MAAPYPAARRLGSRLALALDRQRRHNGRRIARCRASAASETARPVQRLDGIEFHHLSVFVSVGP
jgi:hypothetical protein